jgi:hypothetical protein
MKFWVYSVKYRRIAFGSEIEEGFYYEALKEEGTRIKKFAKETDLSKLALDFRIDSTEQEEAIILFRSPQDSHLEILEKGLLHRLCLPLTQEEIQEFWSSI